MPPRVVRRRDQLPWTRPKAVRVGQTQTPAPAPSGPPAEAPKKFFDLRTILTLGIVGAGAYWLFTYDPTKNLPSTAPKMPKVLKDEDNAKTVKKAARKPGFIFGRNHADLEHAFDEEDEGDEENDSEDDDDAETDSDEA